MKKNCVAESKQQGQKEVKRKTREIINLGQAVCCLLFIDMSQSSLRDFSSEINECSPWFAIFHCFPGYTMT